VFVKVNNILLDSDEYIIDWNNNTITILNPVDNVELSIVTVEGSSQNIIDYGRIITDINVTDYVTKVRYSENLTAHVTINGIKKNVLIIEGENTDKAVIRLEEPEPTGRVLNYIFFNNNDLVNYSQVTKETFTITAETQSSVVLNQAPFYKLPTAYNTLVKVNNRILNAGYNIQYVIPPNREREYKLEEFQHLKNVLEIENLKVFLNGEEITSPVQWSFDLSINQLILSRDVGEPGDIIDIFVITDGEYTINENTVIFNPQLQIDDQVEIYSFSNHDILQAERISYDVVDRKKLVPEDLEYITYNRLTVGEINLRKPAAGPQYLWVSVNGELLSPSVDYDINETGEKLILLKAPAQNDVIDVLHFTAPVRVRKMAFRQFKDILNRTHYKRLDNAATKLAKPLNYFDLRIEVEDGTQLPDPNKGKNLPGIIFINQERIEYFVKEGNILRQLRRGTLGTGIKDVHEIGSEIFDQNSNKTIPYSDLTQTQNETADGNTNQFTLKFTAKNKNEFEVFVAGRRLRKNSIQIFDPSLALDSPSGDVTFDTEFTFDAASNSITLLETPPAEQTVTIVRKIGKLWTALGETLGESQTDIGFFLRASTTELPK
jgi:hypothetical protein